MLLWLGARATTEYTFNKHMLELKQVSTYSHLFMHACMHILDNYDWLLIHIFLVTLIVVKEVS